ncbi:hypothetical protein FAZ19_21400 [Sphingobacterium alkalisoli]|uniref:Neutral/alkaline non-lysosomal ceramidase N-terminal domain-containing protein n=1 Tax=Sphingobacterium alkalisoli TaxID=1874115 RepID=A0A4U0GRF7_9SPHI|nr:neutral/alkaline non-lysosomal ceramidase N-terminal domain-containing protein [Sphingobacterium alkalisoli]TJY61458.1 hypothetical protein FAZ19_21400 [Sphingobacterium alkalisoli]GGH30276.1 alkaline ceramidase [Sphingobacterium alkalisoli]
MGSIVQSSNGDWSGTFGYAEQVITPPLGIYSRNWGAAKFDVATDIHRPLLLQCVVFGEEERNQKVLITADLGWWKNNEDEELLRGAILSHFGLSIDQLLFCLSHTHAGPSICSTDSDLPGGEYIKPYLEFLKNAAILSIERARANLSEVTLNWSLGVCNLATNRDLQVDEEFLIGYNPSKDADQTLLVGKVTDLKGNLTAVICNYACHPTSFAHENTLISPDYVGAMRELIQSQRGVPTVFLQGASGELAPKKQYVKDPEIVDANGRELAYAVLATLEKSDRPNTVWDFEGSLLSGAPLALWREKVISSSTELLAKEIDVTVPYKCLEPVEEIQQEYERCHDRVLKDRLWRKLNTRKSIGDRKFAQIPLWIWKLGDAFVVAQPNEAYSAYQRTVRAAFPNLRIIFVNIANGYIGYLPPEDLYIHDIYAVWQTPYAKGSLEILIEETIKEIQTYLDR